MEQFRAIGITSSDEAYLCNGDINQLENAAVFVSGVEEIGEESDVESRTASVDAAGPSRSGQLCEVRNDYSFYGGIR
jgi:hypothetical protein